MGKKSRARQNRPENRQNQNIKPVPQPPSRVTIDDVSSSKTDAEFEKRKQQLLDQFQKEYDQLQKNKENLETAIESLGKQKADIEQKVIDANNGLKPLDDEIASKQKQLDEIKTKIEEMEEKANTLITDAEAERLKILAEAEEKAENANREYNRSLIEKRDKLNAQEKELDEKSIQLLKEKKDLDYEKEELEEYKSYNEKLRARYEKASPDIVDGLSITLSDEKKKYDELRRIYDEQTEKYNKAQITLENIETDSGISIKNLLLEYENVKKRNKELEDIHKKYPDEERIKELENAKEDCEKLEKKNEELGKERNRYREEVVAMQTAQKELENYKRIVDATKTLNEHLLKELESHKTALESRTGDTCPALTKVDAEVDETGFKESLRAQAGRDRLLNLKEIVNHVKNYAGTKDRLYYRDDDIRAFLAGMAVSRLLILQGMSGTGKSSLPRVFSEAISGFNRLIPVESSWRDRNELLGYYNDFNKKFNARTFTIELYRSGKERCRDIPTFIILDEMNLSRIEYYFSDFLAVLEKKPEDWMIELVSNDMRTLPMEISQDEKEIMIRNNHTVYDIWERIEKSRQGELKAATTDEEKTKLADYFRSRNLLTGAKDLIDGRKVRVYENVWFVGTANRDESTFEITDKVYDRAQVISLDKKGESEGKYAETGQKMINANALLDLFNNAVNSFKERDLVVNRLEELDGFLINNFSTSFGNRIVQQTVKFAAVFTAAGGKPEDALDYQISTKILRKVITSDDMAALTEFNTFAMTNQYGKTAKLIEKRVKDLIK